MLLTSHNPCLLPAPATPSVPGARTQLSPVPIPIPWVRVARAQPVPAPVPAPRADQTKLLPAPVPVPQVEITAVHPWPARGLCPAWPCSVWSSTWRSCSARIRARETSAHRLKDQLMACQHWHQPQRGLFLSVSPCPLSEGLQCSSQESVLCFGSPFVSFPV